MSVPDTVKNQLDNLQVDPEKALNPNWEWSDEVTSDIADRLEGQSLKVCTGLRPVATVNLDILPLDKVINEYGDATYTIDPETGEIQPDDDAHDALGGVFRQGDGFDLPFDDNKFDSVVSDPPWRNLTAEERKQLFQECVRVCKPGGKIIYNATWLPEHERTRLQDKQFRQQEDFWGCASFVTYYRRTPDDLELMEYYEYDVESHREAVIMSREVNEDLMTNPNAVDPAKEAYHCPMCGNTRLKQLGEHTNPTDVYEYDLYECLDADCGFRISESELEQQATDYVESGVESLADWKQYLQRRGFESWVAYKNGERSSTPHAPTEPDSENNPGQEQRSDVAVRAEKALNDTAQLTLLDVETSSQTPQNSEEKVVRETPWIGSNERNPVVTGD